jgi:hypothetical protein
MRLEFILEMIILVLAAWALWKSLPKSLNYDWRSVHAKFLLSLSSEDNKQWKDLARREVLDKPFAILGWEDIDSNSDETQEFLRRKSRHILLIGIGKFINKFSLLLDRPLSEALTIENLSDLIQRRDQRFIFVAEGDKAQELLHFLHQYPAVRDRMAGVCLINPVLDQEWCTEYFTHAEMDVEVQLSIPYFVWGTTEYEGLPTPVVEPRGWKAIDLIDLGVFSEDVAEKWMTKSIAYVLCKTMEVA